MAAAVFSDTLATNLVAQIATIYPAGSLVDVFSGAPPAITAAPTGTLLLTVVLPATPWAPAAARAIGKNGTWQANAVASGNLGWYRLRDANATDPNAADNTHQRIQGDVTATGGGGSMTVDNINVANGQQVTVNGFSVTA